MRPICDRGFVVTVYIGSVMRPICDGGFVVTVYTGSVMRPICDGGFVVTVYTGSVMRPICDGGFVVTVYTGSVMRPICDGGVDGNEPLILIGSSTITCGEDGKWHPEPFPECHLCEYRFTFSHFVSQTAQLVSQCKIV